LSLHRVFKYNGHILLFATAQMKYNTD